MTRTQRLELIKEIYAYVAYNDKDQTSSINFLRDRTMAWDLCQITGAIALEYPIILSPHFGGVKRLRKNKTLWARITPFVTLRVGAGHSRVLGDDKSAHARAALEASIGAGREQ